MYFIQCGRLIDGRGGPAGGPSTVVIDGGRIEAVHAGWLEPPAGVGLLQVRDETLLPGLIDLHVHLGTVHSAPDTALFDLLLLTPQQVTLHIARNARQMLEAGYTTARDMAGYANGRNAEGAAVRDAVASGLIRGPRLLVAGLVGPTGGHFSMGYPVGWKVPTDVQANGPWEVRALVRTYVQEGHDWIKTCTSGGAGGHREALWWRNWTDEELAALVDEAHSVGKPVAVHCYLPDQIKRAIRAGADTIEHGTYLDDECIELLLKHDLTLVPTLSVRSPRALSQWQASSTSQEITRKYETLVAQGGATMLRAFEAGVRIGAGTDMFRSMRNCWGQNAYELELMVGFGVPPAAALAAATGNAARALGAAEEYGTIQPGRLADLVCLEGDPLADIRLLQDTDRLAYVLQAGRIVAGARTRSILPNLAEAQPAGTDLAAP